MSRNVVLMLAVAVLVLGAGTMVFAQEEPAPEAAPAAPAEEAAPEEEAAPVAAERVTDALASLYRSDSVTDGVLTDLNGVPEPLNLVIRSAAPAMVTVENGALVFGASAQPVIPGVFSEEPASALVRAVKQSGKLTIETWLGSANTDQRGPARIVSISRDSAARNVTLGQDQSQFVLRLRTSETNDQGTPELRTPENSVVIGAWQHVVLTFDGHLAVFYVNGEPVAETAHFAGTLQNWDEELHLMLGNEFDGNRQWEGWLCLVALYTDALTPEQVKANFAAGL